LLTQNIVTTSDKMGILEKIQEIEKEIGRTQKNKGMVILLFFVQTAGCLKSLIAVYI
jgi:hypothetical protein